MNPAGHHLHRHCFVIFSLVLLFSFFIQHSSGEIHRAKSSSLSKSRPKDETSARQENVHSVHSQFNEEMNSSQSETWLYALLGSLLICLTGILPLFIPKFLNIQVNNDSNSSSSQLNLLLSFAVGGLLGDVFFHLLPEAWSHIAHGDQSAQRRIGLWVITGLITFFIVEKLVPDDKDDGNQQKTASSALNGTKTSKNGNAKNGKQQHDTTNKVESHSKPKVTAYLNLFANIFDNFTHGLAVAGSFSISNRDGFVTLGAILIHEIPHEIGDFSILLKSGLSPWEAAKLQMSTAVSSLFGAFVGLSFDSAELVGDATAWILPYTSGGFLFVALSTLVPDLLQCTQPKDCLKQFFSVFIGVAVMFVINLYI